MAKGKGKSNGKFLRWCFASGACSASGSGKGRKVKINNEKLGKSAVKPKLSDRAKGLLSGGLKEFNAASPDKQKQFRKTIYKNLMDEKRAQKYIGSGFDEDMVAAGKAFMKKTYKRKSK